MSGLNFCSSSYFLGQNLLHRAIRDIECTFSHYGNYGECILDDQAAYRVLLIFLDDLFNPLDLAVDVESSESAFDKLCKIIRVGLSSNKDPMLLLLLGFDRVLGPEEWNRGGTFQRIETRARKELRSIRDSHSNFFLVDDFFGSARDICISEAFDARNWYLAKCRFSRKGIQATVNLIQSFVGIAERPPKKVLVLDCDNTLWGGVVGEDGVDNLQLGIDGISQAFIDFQKEIKNLGKKGVLLALSSKNNEEDVWSVFDTRPEMVLERKDFVCCRINWNEKSENLKEMSVELGLSLDSFVFWDDSKVEREKMKSLAPAVLTVEAPEDLATWPSHLAASSVFSEVTFVEADHSKLQQYKMKAEFEKGASVSTDLDKYLQSIKMKPQLVNLDLTNISRAVQICKKTNQFNLRTIRHSAESLQKLSPGWVFLLGVDDIYGDHGLVGLMGARYLTSDSLFIDTFALSCRVLGRKLEFWLMQEILSKAEAMGVAKCYAEFIPTDRNGPAKDFLLASGFELKSQAGSTEFGFSVVGSLYSISTDHKIEGLDKIYE